MGGKLLQALSIGAGLMYLFDPDRGKRRRALIRDQAISSLRRTEHTLEAAGRDVSNRLNGLSHDVTCLFQKDEASDVVIAERVRAKMGRYCSHPGAVHVTCHEGRVTLSGPILAHECEDLLAAVCTVRGVREVENRLDLHKQPENISALQGGRPRPGEEIELFQSNWAPATRVMAAAAGGALMLNCLARRTPGAVLMGTLGFGLFMRATTNMETRRLAGMGGGRRGVDIQKTMFIKAPVEQVYDFFTDFERFSRFLVNVEDARELGDGRVRWTLCGPAGTRLHLEEEVTQQSRNELFSWKSTENSAIPYAGTARFESTSDGGTRLDVKMTYNPPGGAITHAIATLFGFDPKSQIEEDLLRVKTYMEQHKVPHDVPAARHHEHAEPRSHQGTEATTAGLPGSATAGTSGGPVEGEGGVSSAETRETVSTGERR